MGEQMTGADIQLRHHRKFLEFRRQDYIIQTDIFEEAFDSATDDQKALIWIWLLLPNPDSLRRWVTKIMLGGNVTMPVLKEIAKINQIPHYSRMTKFELLDALATAGVKI